MRQNSILRVFYVLFYSDLLIVEYNIIKNEKRTLSGHCDDGISDDRDDDDVMTTTILSSLSS